MRFTSFLSFPLFIVSFNCLFTVALKFNGKERLKFLLQHDLFGYRESCCYVTEFFIPQERLIWLNSHFFARLNSINVAAVCSFKNGVKSKVIDINEHFVSVLVHS